jgi:hypothetical protein
VSGSTYAVDQQQQQQNLASLLTLFQQSQTPQGNMLIEQLKQDGYQFNFGELLKRIISSSGIQDWDKILTEMTPQEQGQNILDAHNQQFQQALQQMNSNPAATPTDPSQMGGAPQGQDMGGQVPPQMPPNPMGGIGQ